MTSPRAYRVRARAALLYSGGLDSVAASLLLPDAKPVYVTIGHKYEGRELATARGLRHDILVIEGPSIGHMEADDGHIPHRNAALVTTVAAHGFDTIYIGALKGEASPDKQPGFYRAMSKALSVSEHRDVTVTAPFSYLTKTQLVALAIKSYGREVVLPLLLESRSCYDAYADNCGECQACFRRWVALVNNDLPAGPRPDLPPSRDAVHHLRRAGVTRWPAILRNNYDAAVAILRAYD